WLAFDEAHFREALSVALMRHTGAALMSHAGAAVMSHAGASMTEGSSTRASGSPPGGEPASKDDPDRSALPAERRARSLADASSLPRGSDASDASLETRRAQRHWTVPESRTSDVSDASWQELLDTLRRPRRPKESPQEWRRNAPV